MYSTRLSPRSSSPSRRSLAALTLAAGLAFTSCNGDDDGSNGGTSAPASLGGTWNLFLDGTDCDGDEFSASTLEITETSSGEYLLQVGELPQVFEFNGQREGDTIVASGSSTVGDVTFELEPAVWTIAGNGQRLAGPISTTLTEGGVSCAFMGEMEAFLADATQVSLVRGDWEWAARTSVVSGSCTTVGDVQAFDVTLYPKRQNQFLLDLGLESGESLQFDAVLSGDRLDVSGSDLLANGDLMEFSAPSFLNIDAGGASVMGEFNVSLSGADSCDYTATVTGGRPAVGAPFLSYVRDVEGAQTLMGVRPDEATSSSGVVVLVDSLGSEALGSGALSLDVANFAEVVERPVLAGDGSGSVTMLRDAMVYTAGGDIYWVDLAQRFDVDGGRIVLPPVRVFTGNGSPILSLAVFVDRAQTTTVVVGDRASDRFMIELGVVAPTSASALLTASTDVLGMLMDTDGEYRGMATLVDAGDELRRLSVEQSSELIATGVTSAAVSPAGALYYARAGQLAVIDPGETSTTFLDTGVGATYSLGRFDGERLFASREDLAGASIISREAGVGVIELAQTASVGAGGAAFSDLVPVGDHVVFSMRGGSGTRRVMAVPKAGGTFELLVDAPEADRYDASTAQAMSGVAYFTTPAPSVLALDPTGASAPEELSGFSLRAPFLSDAVPAAGSRDVAAISLVGSGGEIRVLRRGDPTNDPLSSAELVFTAATPDAELILVPTENQLLFADRDVSQSDQFAPLYWTDLAPGSTAVPIANEPGELTLPIR
jgi:hypothetical protein